LAGRAVWRWLLQLWHAVTDEFIRRLTEGTVCKVEFLLRSLLVNDVLRRC
jgi:hypothetical protein